jgi:toxin HigB-1
VIKSFKGKYAEHIWRRDAVKGIPSEVQHVALRKLRMMNNARRLEDMAIPPANHLEKLKGDRKGAYSIRVNKQWRICFRFENGDVYDVELVDYH